MKAIAPATNSAPTQAQSKLIDEISERLIHIKRTGMYIDPLSITMVNAIAMAGRSDALRSTSVTLGKVVLETRSKGQFTIPCNSLDEAKKLAHTIAHLANSRARDSARLRVQYQTDYGKSRLAGDPEWEKARAEREEIFKFFDN